MKKYFFMIFELTALILLFIAAIELLVHFLYTISF